MAGRARQAAAAACVPAGEGVLRENALWAGVGRPGASGRSAPVPAAFPSTDLLLAPVASFPPLQAALLRCAAPCRAGHQAAAGRLAERGGAAARRAGARQRRGVARGAGRIPLRRALLPGPFGAGWNLTGGAARCSCRAGLLAGPLSSSVSPPVDVCARCNGLPGPLSCNSQAARTRARSPCSSTSRRSSICRWVQDAGAWLHEG